MTPLATLQAVAFYLKHHPVGSVRVPLREMVERYQESRKRLGVSKVWLETIEGETRALLKRFLSAACGERKRTPFSP